MELYTRRGSICIFCIILYFEQLVLYLQTIYCLHVVIHVHVLLVWSKKLKLKYKLTVIMRLGYWVF